LGYERYSRDRNSGDYYGRPNSQDYGRDFKSGGSDYYRSSSAREYAASGDYERGDRARGYDQDRQGYRGDRDRPDRDYRGSYASDGHRFADPGRDRHPDDDRHRPDRHGGYGRQPQGYDYDDRGFIARAGDEVRSWFGDDEAERRREADARYDERTYASRSAGDRDDHYHNWRSSQIAALDRDYDEYRSENRSKFENEFTTWRTARQGQRTSLGSVEEHMEVVGSDGSHVGTVDKVRGDRILLTKNDKDAGGVHHSIPSRWIQSVDTRVTLSKSADEAKAAWRDEERQAAASDYGDRTGRDRDDRGLTRGRTLDRSFSGTY